MKSISACLSHNSDNWKTPSELYNLFVSKGYIDTFPFESSYNEFEKNYFNCKIFSNPPYSKMAEVVNWIYKQFLNNNKIVLLVPVRTDTKWFEFLYRGLWSYSEFYFIKGRLRFNDSKSAPFPSMLIIIHTRVINLSHPFMRLISKDEIKCLNL